MERITLELNDVRAVRIISVESLACEVTAGWRCEVPDLGAESVMLRELRRSDAASLFAMLTTKEVSRFIVPPPASIDGFERFIEWAQSERRAGRYVSLAVVPRGYDTAMGVFQIRQLEPGFKTAEWRAAIGSPFWGTGVFADAANLMLEFVFDTIGIHRLEARCQLQNGRGNGALRKLGAVQECVLRQSVLNNGEWLDEALYSIVAAEWKARQEVKRNVYWLN